MTVDPPAPEPMEQRAERLAADLAAAVRRAEDAERIANNRARELTDARIAADRAEAERDAATAERDAARAALQRWQYYGCPDCGGDCASANPPIACCIMRETHEALTSAKEA